MTVMTSDSLPNEAEKVEKDNNDETVKRNPAVKTVTAEPVNILSEAELPKDSKVDISNVTPGNDNADKRYDIRMNRGRKDLIVTSEDKVRFIDSVVNNTRFTRDYSLFGGKIKFTLRSLTVDEVNAISTWMAKVGTSDPAGLMAGRYRKYFAIAHMLMYNGVEIPPLAEPLFETLGSDGKTTVKPGWIDSGSFWDGIGFGIFSLIMECIEDFDVRYSILCKEASNENFWHPDTP